MPDRLFARLGHAGLYNIVARPDPLAAHAKLVTALVERGSYALDEHGGKHGLPGEAIRRLSASWREQRWCPQIVVPPGALYACLAESAQSLASADSPYSELSSEWLATARRRNDVWASLDLPSAAHDAAVIIAYWTEPPFHAAESPRAVNAVEAARVLIEDLYLDIDNLFSTFVFDHGGYITPDGQLNKLAFAHFLDARHGGDLLGDPGIEPLLGRLLHAYAKDSITIQRDDRDGLLLKARGYVGMTGQPDLRAVPAIYLLINRPTGRVDDGRTLATLRMLAAEEKAAASSAPPLLANAPRVAPSSVDLRSPLVTFSLPNDLMDELRARLAMIAVSPYTALEAFQTQSQAIVASLIAGPMLNLLHDLLYRRTDHIALLVRNLPIDLPLPPTPLDGRVPADKRSFVSEGVLMGFGRLLGEPFGFVAEKSGEILQNVCPIPGRELTRTNEGSRQGLGFHTEIAFHPLRPHHLLLYCLRSDHEREAETTLVDLVSAIRELSAEDVGCLREARFAFGAPESFGHDFARRQKSVLSGHHHALTVCLNFNTMEPTDARSGVALHNLQVLMDRHRLSLRLEPGDLLIVDNRRAVHGRTRFRPRFDGADRWLQRIYVHDRLWQHASGILAWPARVLPAK